MTTAALVDVDPGGASADALEMRIDFDLDVVAELQLVAG